jgi:hypothetical protein
MEYTLEQKALAAIRGDLWWRVPDGAYENERTWSLLHEDVAPVELGDLQKRGVVYHIGPKAPPIMSELEAELLAALELLFVGFKGLADSGDAGNWRLEDLHCGKVALSAIKKARGEA